MTNEEAIQTSYENRATEGRKRREGRWPLLGHRSGSDGIWTPANGRISIPGWRIIFGPM